MATSWRREPSKGLSPRVRGNRADAAVADHGRGSIPACAGEPGSASTASRPRRVYPRVCGGTCSTGAHESRGEGLSPRVRGNRQINHVGLLVRGSIPACAGEPPCTPPVACRQRVYPRVCGGTTERLGPKPPTEGLSPRVRGNLRVAPHEGRRVGSIPACAGEPEPVPSSASAWVVYPRVCGGTCAPWPVLRAQVGLSPRVRGNPGLSSLRFDRGGSIPACAGEPTGRPPPTRSPRVYPRVCGGTVCDDAGDVNVVGLSPRVRGNPLCSQCLKQKAGSIPACAGEPPSRGAWRCVGRVYPRVCGGTFRCLTPKRALRGLSPRVRGNRSCRAWAMAIQGSIPACAGEPSRWLGCRSQSRVYPRVCGGTTATPAATSIPTGLSPRVRGNRVRGAVRRERKGSIPACAGEPRSTSPPVHPPRVYPRVCGGTAPACEAAAMRKGLSPRVRGNPDDLVDDVRPAGSIPACAGEPRSSSTSTLASWVYPRVCGGTHVRQDQFASMAGLSPRVRGNRRKSPQGRLQCGSIPACAGEPRRGSAGTARGGVYPRVCGGTRLALLRGQRVRGLSPRVRGNLDARICDVRRLGSIPACAGEPPDDARQKPRRRVYPRVCGGTAAVEADREFSLGLSPRVRGNRRHPHPPRPDVGSIPACAGEPIKLFPVGRVERVYPRVCGGTLAASDSDRQIGGLSPRVRGNRRALGIIIPNDGSIPACAGEPMGL